MPADQAGSRFQEVAHTPLYLCVGGTPFKFSLLGGSGVGQGELGNGLEHWPPTAEGQGPPFLAAMGEAWPELSGPQFQPEEMRQTRG